MTDEESAQARIDQERLDQEALLEKAREEWNAPITRGEWECEKAELREMIQLLQDEVRMIEQNLARLGGSHE